MSGAVDDFDSFAVAVWPQLVRASVLMGCSLQDAEDLAQTTLTKALLHWHRVEAANDRHSYVRRILVNSHISSRRRMWRRERPTANPTETRMEPGHELSVLDRHAIADALNTLPRDQRIAVVLRYYLDCSEVQMAAILDVAQGTVKSRLSRALASLAINPALISYEETP